MFIGLGSNQGERERTLRAAVRALSESPAFRGVRASSFVQTKPMGPVPQPDFLNGVVAAESDWEPEALLVHLHEIEASLGLDRRTKVRWGPRPIDLDLLMVGDLVRCTDGLTLPHPGMVVRRFVLAPLCELAPDAVHPTAKKSMATLLEGLP